MIALTPALQRFDWGSTDGIPALLGFEPDGSPYAEAWWGAHPLAPSLTSDGPLDRVIAADPVAALGDDCAAEHRRLPYLLKVLSIARPLSIQVHPTSEHAHRGFEEEEARGLPFDDPSRTYKDASHKPEMLVALTDLTLLSGFREPHAVAADLRALGGHEAETLAELVESKGIRGYVDAVLTEPHGDAVERVARAPHEASAPVVIARDALTIYPGDAGALVAVAMNAVTLAPGETLYTPSGVVHCYVSGMGVEIMANSDNVVRAGFTHKPINAPLLRELATLAAAPPVLPSVEQRGAAKRLVTDANEFELVVVRDGLTRATYGPRIVLVLEGTARITTQEGTAQLGRGEAIFVPAVEGPADVDVQGFAIVACARSGEH